MDAVRRLEHRQPAALDVAGQIESGTVWINDCSARPQADYKER